MHICLSLFVPLDYVAILSPVAIVGGLYFFFCGFRLLAQKRQLITIPSPMISTALRGLAEFRGEASGPYTLTAPITGKPCFLYRTTVWQEPAAKTADWVKVADETLPMPFFLEDATGQLLVEPLGVELDLRPGFSEEYDASPQASSLDQIPPRISVFLLRQGVVPTRRLRVEETTITAGDPLFVTGTIVENPGVEVRPFVWGQKSEAPDASDIRPPTGKLPGNIKSPQVINLSTSPGPSEAGQMTQQAKIAAALNRAGITRPEAWSAAGVPYQSVALEENAPGPGPTSIDDQIASPPSASVNAAEPTKGNSFDLIPPVVLMKGESASIFLISSRSQKDSAGPLAFKSAALICGGFAITLLGLYALLKQMRLLG